jgi:O-methyltransferase
MSASVKTLSNVRVFVGDFAKILITFANKILSNIMFVMCVKMRDPLWKRQKFIYGYDYIRFSSLGLVSHEIYENQIQGCVAELGVYRGDFARCINEAFPDRSLYLFDTFEGFDKQDLEKDARSSFSKNAEKVFSNTSVDIVLKKMKHKNNCIVKKGWFPETTTDVEETFAFVSSEKKENENAF